MATTAYLVTIDPSGLGQVLQGGANAVVVAANSSTEAKQFAAAALGFDAMDAVWLGSTEVTVTAIAAATDWADPITWNFRVVVSVAGGAELYNVTVQSTSTNDTVDEIAAALVTALEAAGGTALTPSYDSTSQVLTIAAIADGIGTHQVNCYAWPNIVGGDNDGPYNVSTFFGTVVDEGIAGAVLTVTLCADALTVGKVYGSFRQVTLSL